LEALAPAPASDAVEQTLRMGVENIGFMLERLGRDCDDLQFIRELTENAIEAEASKIVWDVDWPLWELTDQQQYKLCVIDDGRGMTGEEMLRYINNLSASIHEQAIDKNFGVGAKVAAATRNPAGLIYQSWKDGQGAMIQLWRDPKTREYGLRQFERPDGSFGYWQPLSPAAKPDLISDHGTKVVLLGEGEEHNTIEPPDGVPIPSRWVNRYLNARYFRFPEGVEVKAREGWHADPDDSKRNVRRRVRGQKEFLDGHSVERGALDLSEARIHWWILDESEARTKASEMVNVGHFASLFQDELYELRTGRAGVTRLHQFGVIFGYERVVLYAEPFNGATGHLEPNTARTQLLRDGHPLPYAEWAAEFRAAMPQEIKDHMDAVIAGTHAENHREAIQERLSTYAKLFRLSRYRQRSGGSLSIGDAGMPKRRGLAIAEDLRDGDEGNPTPKKDSTGRLLAAMLAEQGDSGEEDGTRKQELPEVKWVSEAEGTRASGVLEDRAATYIKESNLIQANADFRVFTDMVEFWCQEYQVEPGNRSIADAVHEWFEQALVETVIGCQALQDEQRWSPDDIDTALSDEALTASVMQRYHVANAVKRTLGARLGSLKRRDPASEAA
jgi:histidine kinase/DNA gyrase B/HSP90-like ATPase